MRKAGSRYFIEWDPAAQRDVEDLRPFDARRIVRAIRELRYQAEVQAKHRKPLLARIPAVPDASWELRIGDLRAFYEVRRDGIVRVLRVILKGRRTTDE